jgi:hypothetical protein
MAELLARFKYIKVEFYYVRTGDMWSASVKDIKGFPEVRLTVVADLLGELPERIEDRLFEIFQEAKS